MSLLNIGFDCDESIFNFMRPLNEFLLERGIDVPDYEDIHTFDLWKVWECTREEAFRRVDMFYNSEAVKEITPRDGAREAIANVCPPNTGTVVTSRPIYTADVTRYSFAKHFPTLFKEIHHTDQYSLHLTGADIKVTKGTIARDKKYDFFVEDALHHAIEIASHGVQVFLLPTPWNRGKPVPPGVTRGDWHEFPAFVESYKYARSKRE